MASDPCYNATILFFFFFFFLSTGLAAAGSIFISDAVFDSHGSTGRSLLQAKKSCEVNFEFMNYTILTSQCKGPKYPADRCCAAFKEFACPYADQINDGSTDCAPTMFSYINLYGKYPPGLFANECREGKLGLACGVEDANSGNQNASGAGVIRALSPPVMLAAGFFALLLGL